MTSQRHAKRGFRLRRCGCASWSRSTPPPNPRRAPRRKRRRSSHANRRKDRTEEDKKPLTKLAPEFPLDLRTKTNGSGGAGSGLQVPGAGFRMAGSFSHPCPSVVEPVGVGAGGGWECGGVGVWVKGDAGGSTKKNILAEVTVSQ